MKYRYPTLEYFLRCYYHQDWQCEFKKHTELWSDFFDNENKEASIELEDDLYMLLPENDEYILEILDKYADGHTIKMRKDPRDFFTSLYKFLNQKNEQNSA